MKMTFWDIFVQNVVFYRQEFIVLRTALGGDTRDIAEPTYKTFNLHTRQKYDRIQDFQLTYKTFNLPTRQQYDRIQDFQLTYKTVNKLLYKNPTAYKTFNQLTRVSTYQLGFKPKN